MNKISIQPIKTEEVTKVVQNFQLFCEYIKSHPVFLTPTLLEIGKKDCFEINRLLQYPRSFQKPLYLMTSYPTIALYFQLILNLGIFDHKKYRKGKYKGKSQLIPTVHYNHFSQLPDLAKYILLFWGFWVNSSFQYLNKDTLFFFNVENAITEGFELLKECKPNQQISLTLPSDKFSNYIDSPYHELLYLHGTSIHHFRDFGFWEYEETFDTSYPSTRDIHVQSIIPTRLGIEMVKCCCHFPLPICNRYYDAKESSFFQITLQPLYQYARSFNEAFEPLFPGLIPFGLDEPVQSTVKPSKNNQIGTVSIKVTLQDAYRVIKISFHHTLEDLHLAIQTAFEFDNDHLYAFHMDGNIRSRDDIYWGGDDEPPYASKTYIGQFNWQKGQKFIYHFDFGDDWFFKCKVEEVNPDEDMQGYPREVKSKGIPPEQYPIDEYDEEDDSNIAIG